MYLFTIICLSFLVSIKSDLIEFPHSKTFTEYLFNLQKNFKNVFFQSLNTIDYSPKNVIVKNIANSYLENEERFIKNTLDILNEIKIQLNYTNTINNEFKNLTFNNIELLLNNTHKTIILFGQLNLKQKSKIELLHVNLLKKNKYFEQIIKILQPENITDLYYDFKYYLELKFMYNYLNDVYYDSVYKLVLCYLDIYTDLTNNLTVEYFKTNSLVDFSICIDKLKIFKSINFILKYLNSSQLLLLFNDFVILLNEQLKEI
jgi:hypothetical protein